MTTGSTTAPAPAFTSATVRSTDGTEIEYLAGGTGPRLVLVPGALAVAADLIDLAAQLAPCYSIAIVQRRGRGGSGPQGADYSIDRECEDLAAVWEATGGRFLFGHSFGGLVALRFARGRTDVRGLATYEPGVSDRGSIPVGWLPRARAELDRGDSFAAFLTFAKGVNPTQTGRVPRPLLGLIIKRAIPADKLKQNLELMPQCLLEHHEVGRLDRSIGDYQAVDAPALLLRGTKGGPNEALGTLADVLPDAESVALAGLDHFGPEAAPHIVAERLMAFFGGLHEVGN